MSEEKKLPVDIQKVLDETQIDRSVEYKEFKNNLIKSLYYFTDSNAFIGGMLQEMNFKPEYRLPTAALAYDKKRQQFEIIINPTFFNKLPLEHQMGVLHHEILHFTNAHHFRFDFDQTKEKDDKKRANIAADMAINQYIASLPQGCVDVKFYETDDKQPFPRFATAEVYQQLLKDNPDAQKNAVDKMKKEFGSEEKDFGNGEGLIDEHSWEDLSEEEKKQMAEEMKKIVKRTMEKTSYDMTSLPQAIKDLVEEIDVFLRGMNYRQILQSAIKKSVSFSDRMNTWKRPNKRYGTVAQGSTLAKLPQLNVYIDTSGSISVKEMNEFLTVLNGFLKAGSRKCQLGLWHTQLYKKKKYKLNQNLLENEIESGGTDMTQVCEDINKMNPDLSIILTDGYFSTNVNPKFQTIVIISENGGMKHPLVEHSNVTTIAMTGLKD